MRRAGAKRRLPPLFSFFPFFILLLLSHSLLIYLFSLFFPHTYTHHHTKKQTTTYTALSNYLCVLRIDIFSPSARPILYTYNDGAHARAFV